jgi:S-formylglutathione hydrolase FrmB
LNQITKKRKKEKKKKRKKKRRLPIMKKKLIAFFIATLTIVSLTVFTTTEAPNMESRIAEINSDANITVTTVLLDSASPTGAFVTFRYPANEELVRVAVGCDEMTFANENEKDIAPENWTPGSWVHSNVRTSTARDMELIGDYWCATWPATNGSLLYYFYLGYKGDAYVGMENTRDFCEAAIAANNQRWDPQNEPAIASWETQDTFAANQRRSLIYVPRAEDIDMLDLSLQDPYATEEKGSVTFCQIPGTINGDPAHINCSVYLPYGFDLRRTEAYPLYVLYHGANGDYTQWVAHGAADHIMNNAIAQGIIEPTVVVMPDGMDSGWDLDFVVNAILPYMQQNYNCSTNFEQLAISGLSAGGALTGNMLINHPTAFKYYGGFSMFGRTNNRGIFYIDLDDPALSSVKLYASYGDNDYTGERCQTSIDKLSTRSEIDLTHEILHGAHQMYYWRQALESFIRTTLWK